jgi:hypothetical protein
MFFSATVFPFPPFSFREVVAKPGNASHSLEKFVSRPGGAIYYFAAAPGTVKSAPPSLTQKKALLIALISLLTG